MGIRSGRPARRRVVRSAAWLCALAGCAGLVLLARESPGSDGRFLLPVAANLVLGVVVSVEWSATRYRELVLGPAAIMFGWLVDMMIVLPVWSLATHSVGATRGTGTARYRVYFSLFMIDIIALAILLAAGSRISSHGQGIVSLVLALAGVASTHGAGSAVLWAARATFALFIALGVDMNCDDRRLHAGH